MSSLLFVFSQGRGQTVAGQKGEGPAGRVVWAVPNRVRKERDEARNAVLCRSRCDWSPRHRTPACTRMQLAGSNSAGRGLMAQQQQKHLSQSNVKGTLRQGPSRKRPPELQRTVFKDNDAVEGQVLASQHKEREDAKTMSKSKRLEPCGRCQVMTAVRVALPCGRLVNLCIPCASTFARFLSKRIRDLARESLSDQAARAQTSRQQKSADTQSEAGAKLGTRGTPPRAVQRGTPPLVPQGRNREHQRPSDRAAASPLEIANEQLNDRAMERDAAARVLGRSKGRIPDNPTGGGLSPTFRGRRGVSPQRTRNSSLDGPGNEKVHRDMLLDGERSRMIVGERTSPFHVKTQQEALWHASRHTQKDAREVGAEGDMASRRKSSKSREGHRRDRTDTPRRDSPGKSWQWQSSRVAAGSQDGSHSMVNKQPRTFTGGSPNVAAPGRIMSSLSESTCASHEALEAQRDRILLTHGKVVSQTVLSDGKRNTSFPGIKTALTDDVNSPVGPSPHSRLSNDMLLARTPPLNPNAYPPNASSWSYTAKDSAVRLERSRTRAKGSTNSGSREARHT